MSMWTETGLLDMVLLIFFAYKAIFDFMEL